MLRKMRRVKRRSTVRIRRRSRRRRVLLPKSMMPEVKYATYIDVAKSIKNNFTTTASGDLLGHNQFYTDIFSIITKGTNDQNRIGDRIFVKFITIHIFVQGCIDATTPDTVTNFLLRLFVHNARQTAGTTIPNFFRGLSVSPITHLKPDRRNLTVWYDKMYPMICQSSFTAATKGAGAMRLIKVKLPVYRQITFDTNNSTKDENSVYSISMAGYNMAGAADTAKQMACMDVCYRIYFTDT